MATQPKNPSEGNAQPETRVIVAGLTGAVLAALAASPQVTPELRQICETQLGAVMVAQARAEGNGRRDWPRLEREAVAAHDAGMTVSEISFCLDVGVPKVEMWLDGR